MCIHLLCDMNMIHMFSFLYTRSRLIHYHRKRSDSLRVVTGAASPNVNAMNAANPATMNVSPMGLAEAW